MSKTNWQDPRTGEIISPHISGLQEAVGKIEESIGIESVGETDIPLIEVFISNDDRCRIYQAPEGKRNWLLSPTPSIKKNGIVITSDFEIDYGGGAVVFTTPILETDILTADVTYTAKIEGNQLFELGNRIIQTGQNSKDYTDQQIALITETGIPKPVEYEYRIIGLIEQAKFDIPLETFDKNTDIINLYVNSTYYDRTKYTVTNKTESTLGYITLNNPLEEDKNIVIQIKKNVPIGEEGSVSGSVIAVDSIPQNRVQGLVDLDKKVNTVESNLETHKDEIATNDSYGHIKLSDIPTIPEDIVVKSDIAEPQILNMVEHDGRFAIAIDKNNDLYIGDFIPSVFFIPQNNTAPMISAGKFIHNNTTNGGSRGELTQDVQDLIVAMGRTDASARYGVEFHVGQLTMGNGTSSPINGKYLMTTNPYIAFINGKITASFWVRVKSGDSIIIGSTSGNLKEVNIEDGWTFVTTRHELLSFGYNNAFPPIRANEGTVVQIALPFVYIGGMNRPIHATPVPSKTSKYGESYLGTVYHNRNEVTQPKLKDYTETRQLMAYFSGETILDMLSGNVFVLMQPSGAATLKFTNVPESGQVHSFTIIITQSTTPQSFAFPASVKWQNGEIPNLNTSSKTYILTFLTYDGGISWLGMYGGVF